jgi:Leucine-rich repeat (LRR) protein
MFSFFFNKTWTFKEYDDWIVKGCPINKQVTHLGLINQEYTSITPNIKNLPNLKTFICIGNNMLSQIPVEIGECKNLVNISESKLTTIPVELFNLVKINIIHFTMNNIESIPCEIGNLKNIEVFDFSSNLITEIPKTIGNLKKVTFISLSNNKLSNIPFEIGDLVNLKGLDIENNLIESILPTFGNLKNLEAFDMTNNLFELPSELGISSFISNKKSKESFEKIYNEVPFDSFDSFFNDYQDNQSNTFNKFNTFKYESEDESMLKKIGITTKEWKHWMIFNNPDKGGGDTELFIKVLNIGRNIFKKMIYFKYINKVYLKCTGNSPTISLGNPMDVNQCLMFDISTFLVLISMISQKAS